MRTVFDTRTLVFSAMITDVVCLLVILLLWHQSRKRFAGTGFWVLDFTFQTAGLLLITLRGSIHDWMSMVLASTLILGGTILGYAGLGRFIGKKTPQAHNTILLAAFVCIQVTFALVRPNLAARNLNISTALLIVYFQCMWLLLYSIEPEMRRLTFGVGMVFGGYCLFTIARVGGVFFATQGASDFLQSGGLSLVFISYQVLFIFLTYSLVLMVNKRLFAEVQIQEEKFAKAFRSSPYAIALTRLSDGEITEVNDGFLNITGYRYAEAVGKKSVDLHLWNKEEDRATLITELSKNGKVQNREFQFRKKSGERLTGLLSAEVLTINNQEFILSSINDITERKRSEEALRESEEKYRKLVQYAPAGIYEIDFATGRFTEVNDVMCQILGYTRDEFLGMTAFDILDDKGKVLFTSRIRLGRSGVRPNEAAEYLVRTKDGRLIWALLNITFRWDGEKIAGATVVAHDVTDRKRAEEALRENQTFLSAIMESTPDPVYVKDSQSRIVMANPALAKVVGKPLEEILGKTDSEYYDDLDTGRALREHDLQVMKSQQGEVMEETVPTPYGYRTFLSSKTPYRDASGDIIGLTGISRDITERKRVEMQLKEMAEKYSALFNANSDGVWIHDLRGNILEVNDAYCRMSGYSRDELIHMPISRIAAVRTPEEIADHIKRVVEAEGHDRFESRHRRKDGSIFDVDVTAFFLGKARASIASFVRDITERKRAEEALHSSEERLRLAQEASHVGVWDFNFATKELRWTPELEAIYGLEPGSVRTYQDFATRVHPDDLQTVETKRNEAVDQQKAFEFEFRIQRPRGETAWVYCRGGATYDLEGRPTRIFGVNIDITERKRNEEALKKAYEELEKRVQERTSELSEAVERLRIENIQCKRLEDTLRESENQVRFFASQCLTAQETERKRVAGELHDSIASALGAMKMRIDKAASEMRLGFGNPETLHDLGSNVTEINNEVRRIMADLRPSILDDLGIHAAMNWFCREYEKTYSHIRVEKRIDLAENDVTDSLKTAIFRISQEAMNNIAKHSQASSVSLNLHERNGGIELTIQDNGGGFDPNTTKRGLGLSTMRERAQLSGGSFDLESAAGKGTLIRVSWPL